MALNLCEPAKNARERTKGRLGVASRSLTASTVWLCCIISFGFCVEKSSLRLVRIAFR